MTADNKLLPLPTGYSADEWGGSDTGPCLHMDEQVQDYARANVAHATAQLQAEIEALRADVEAWKASHSMLTDTCHHFQARAVRLAEALRLIAAPIRPDGTWNRDREACRQIAEEALRDQEKAK